MRKYVPLLFNSYSIVVGPNLMVLTLRDSKNASIKIKCTLRIHYTVQLPDGSHQKILTCRTLYVTKGLNINSQLKMKTTHSSSLTINKLKDVSLLLWRRMNTSQVSSAIHREISSMNSATISLVKENGLKKIAKA